ncbi:MULTISPECIES: acyl carrier protein [unclassified Micromonospora]|uniref:acyl carrier protein n=1 Tax=unclassified Micromonospora TaxID=2617518 RepID=UPI00362F9A02
MGDPVADRCLAEILAVCADVLGRRPAAEENLFDVGGDSATATDLILRLEARLGRELDVALFFEAEDFRELAARLAGSTDAPGDPSDAGALR